MPENQKEERYKELRKALNEYAILENNDWGLFSINKTNMRIIAEVTKPFLGQECLQKLFTFLPGDATVTIEAICHHRQRITVSLNGRTTNE